ncbi:MAG: class I SAM-dependent methyltransferase [Anaerolineaceae bacterium]|nr:class I SAM-dependent methyltransferase [Anaerolineaceae bacterium]
MGQLVSNEEIQYYDIVQDWPGEIDFYRSMTHVIKTNGGTILEIGCGTGRVTTRLAVEGVSIVGLDLSPGMLEVAGKKSQGLPNVSWVEGDMLDFDLGEQFDLIIIPGHSFHFMLTIADQITCLSNIRRHLKEGGKAVIHMDHQNLGWLGELIQKEDSEFKLSGEYYINSLKKTVRKWNSWRYEASTQTASAITAWEIIGENGVVLEKKETIQKHSHCFFRFEMELLLAKAGFVVEELYGDFYRQELNNTSPDMIWVIRSV